MDIKAFTKHVQGINNAAFCSLLLSTGHELGLFDLMIKENKPITSQQLADIAGMKERLIMDVKAFTKHVQGINNAAYCSLLHELGLFDLMMKENRPVTSQQLADIGGMKERYVREWLSGAAVSRFINVEPETMSFYIPAEHRDVLKHAAINAIGLHAYTARSSDLQKCFMKDGPYGYTYNHDDSLWQWMRSLKASRQPVKDTVVPYFKEAGILDKLESGVSVIDLCCGSGDITIQLSNVFPKSSFTGAEYFEIPFKRTKERVSSSGLENCSVIQEDVHDLPDDMKDTYDIVAMFDSLHDLPDPHKALTQIYKVLKPGGTFIIQEYSPSSNIKDNIGNLAVGRTHIDSMFCCLPSSMSDAPHIGYGLSWGRENILTALQTQFIINHSFKLGEFTTLDFCIKK